MRLQYNNDCQRHSSLSRKSEYSMKIRVKEIRRSSKSAGAGASSSIVEQWSVHDAFEYASLHAHTYTKRLRAANCARTKVDTI